MTAAPDKWEQNVAQMLNPAHTGTPHGFTTVIPGSFNQMKEQTGRQAAGDLGLRQTHCIDQHRTDR